MTYVVLDLPFRRSAVGVARRWVLDACRVHLPDAASQQVLELLTSELVANAVLHGSPPVTVAVTSEPGQVRVEVGDGSGDRPQRREVAPEATGGRGVALVDLLAKDWGVHPRPDGSGKVVWFSCAAGTGFPGRPADEDG
ncbi:ATP-binding protein [Kineococcus rhizosphaerae]|uniref:Anti-sigma regulatory factor (Ser/Thr protein kinase) n=1 Tax=Kineococcus rhizosphaerae TaxID=559628 RepID=A0A2T0R164_9ACTN|nr:ATP-binding protein [Kineococcus rhizosphaerae]PRY13020.1 anti-sigma regulatory factor (Ser/Thr protein kinase) [Kineococcus rhizosphaerae]